MPTGYTARIEDGEVTTGKAFLNSVCKGFGICMGNSKLPLENDFVSGYKVSDYHQNALKEAEKKLKHYQEISDKELQKEIDTKYDERIASAKSYIAECDEKNLRYKKVKKEVLEWEPPTPEHDNLKKFALDQIDLCYPITYEYSLKDLDRPKETVDEYRKVAIESACYDIKHHNEKIIDEQSDIKSRIKWVKDFRDSFKNEKEK